MTGLSADLLLEEDPAGRRLLLWGGDDLGVVWKGGQKESELQTFIVILAYSKIQVRNWF